MNDLIFGKDNTQRIVSVEPGTRDKCVLFIQNQDGTISQKEVPLTHWIIYTEKLSPKHKELAGNQPYKWLIEYDHAYKYKEVLEQTRYKRIDHYIARDPKEAFMIKNGVTYYKGLKVKDVAVLSFDLEHTYGIGDKLNSKGKLLLISNTFRSINGHLSKKLFSFDMYSSEREMINDWCNWVRSMDPSVVVGHNLFGHDFKILRYAADKANCNLSLGRNGSPIEFDRKKSHKRKDGSQSYEYFNAYIYGREIVDTFFLALTYDVARNYESYGLKQIIKQENLEKPGRVYYDASKIAENYQDPAEWEKIKAYAIDDSDEALALFDLMIAPFFYATQSIPRSLQHVINSATGGQINSIMVRAYLQQGHSIARSCERVEYPGAISFGIPGIHKNVLRFDVASLYPSIILSKRIYDPVKDPQALFLKMVEYFYRERLENKRIGKETGDRYYKDLEQSQKIFINSAYGFLGAGRLNYNVPKGADAVTYHGREILKKAIYLVTGQEYKGDIEEVENAESDT